MNFNKLLIVSVFVGTSFGADVRPVTDAVGKHTFKGNWTETFETPYGPLIHTPTCLKFCGMSLGKELSLPAGMDYFGYVFPAPLLLKTDSTREEFVEAMQRLSPPPAQTGPKTRSKKASSKHKKAHK